MVYIKQNEDTKEKWDLEEHRGFRTYSLQGKSYSVNIKRSENNAKEAAILLMYIEQYVDQLIADLVAVSRAKQVSSPNIDIIAETPYRIQEIEYSRGYYGINKPKNIYEISNPKRLFALDNRYRATWRLIMLSLRSSNGNFKEWKSIKNTLIHELAHTMCNHVTYRESGNHQKDFNDAEQCLIEISKNGSQALMKIENIIRGITK